MRQVNYSAGPISVSFFIVGTVCIVLPFICNRQLDWPYLVREIGVGGNWQYRVAFLDADTNLNYKEILSTLLAAKMTNRQVKILTNGCGGNTGGFPIIIEIVLL